MPFYPTEEQEIALEAFRSGQTIKIVAYAGTGKTTTLIYLAQGGKGRGQYLAFNRALAEEARSKFPSAIRCTTNHALAFGATRQGSRYSDRKLTESGNANLISQALQLAPQIRFDCVPKLVLSNRSYAALLRSACRRFLYSQSAAPLCEHIPRYGRLAELNSAQFNSFAEEVLPRLRQLWSNMQDPTGLVPLGHDGYLKLWSLSSPKIKADYIMLDEAQDSNPVVLQVLADQQCQIVYVGDPYQQIYEWRGAVNAMSRVEAPRQVSLTESFRFGPSIAEAASKVIALLGAKMPIRGNTNIRSGICPVYPEAVLCRTNAGVISRLIESVLANRPCQVLGGTRDLQALLEDVQRLKRGAVAELPEFFGFRNWAEVMAFADVPEGEDLKTFVRLVDQYGESSLLAVIGKCHNSADQSAMVLSTTHKAKGQQWKTVSVHSDFEVLFQRLTKHEQQNGNFEAGARLLYVAMTRAQIALDPPPGVMDYFGLKRTTIGNSTSGVSRDRQPGRLLSSIKAIFFR